MTEDDEPLGEPDFHQRPICPYTRLFQAVIVQAVRDLSSPAIRDPAVRWLDSTAFEHVCLLAGWEPQCIRASALKLEEVPREP